MGEANSVGCADKAETLPIGYWREEAKKMVLGTSRNLDTKSDASKLRRSIDKLPGFRGTSSVVVVNGRKKIRVWKLKKAGE